MLPVSDMYYPDAQEPYVSIYGNEVASGDRSRSRYPRGYLSRQDSRNFRSSASPPPSRSRNHASSWFGLRKTSLSPPRSRHYGYGSSGYSSRHHRSPERSSRSWFGFGSRRSPRHGSSYYDDSGIGYGGQRADFDGYTVGSGYGNRYGDGYSSHGYSSGSSYASSQLYHGQSTATIPRTYQSTYGQTNVNSELYSESVMLQVPMCCQACEDRITNHMLALPGVSSVTCDQMDQMVTVRGTAAPGDILRQAQDCFRHATFWTR